MGSYWYILSAYMHMGCPRLYVWLLWMLVIHADARPCGFCGRMSGVVTRAMEVWRAAHNRENPPPYEYKNPVHNLVYLRMKKK